MLITSPLELGLESNCRSNKDKAMQQSISNISHFPCGTCDVSVSWSEKGVACDTCGLWFHARCQSINSADYSELHDEEIKWHCAICGNPNSDTVFDLHGVDWSYQSIMTDSSYDPLQDSCKTPTESEFRPFHSSTPTRANQQNKRLKRPLRILNINFQSCSGKRAETLILLDSTKPDIILATETWLNENITNQEVIPEDYSVYRRDRNTRGGGVLIAVRKDLKSYAVPELSTDCEIVWAAVRLTGRKTLYLCSYYRPHASDEMGLIKLEESLDRASSISDAYFVIGGDFNLPDWDWKEMSLKPEPCYPRLHKQFVDCTYDHNLEQMVLEPTRGENTLDLILTNYPQMVPRVEVIPGLSDHSIVYCEFAIHPVRSQQVPRSIPLYDKADWQEMKAAMLSLYQELEKENGSLTTDELWVKFRDGLNDAVKTFVPHKAARLKTRKPWISSEIRKMMKRRDRVYKRMKKSGSEELKKELQLLRRTIQRMTRRSYWQYIEKLVIPEEENNGVQKTEKPFYNYIKHQKSSSSRVAPLKVNGRLIHDPKEQAQALNHQFQSVFGDGDEFTEEEFNARCRPSIPDIDLPSILDNIEVSEDGVRKLLRELIPHKACGPDKVHPRVLKELADEVAPILTMIYKSSLKTGLVPSDWRTANVAPIFKKGEHYDPANYRPVSLTSVPCKILEHIITSALTRHMEGNGILCPEQHGFRKTRSCETQLLEFTGELFETMEGGNQADILILDFAKAFDRVNHSLLIHKLQHYGIRGKVKAWIQAYLKDRQQTVLVNGANSEMVTVKSGVPQGSVIGPILFLAYVNDLPSQLTSPARLFADDTAVYRLAATTEDHSQLQQDLQRLEEWELCWDMQFHPAKCVVLHVTRKRTVAEHQYQLHGQTLQTVSSAKYLGITLTSNLSWDSHIGEVCTKANRALGFLRRNLKVASTRVKCTAYKAFVRPTMEYACTVWDPYTQANINALEAVQRRAARFILNRHKRVDSVTAMLTKLQLLPLSHRRKVARLAMMWKITRGDAAIDRRLLVTATRQQRGHEHQYQRIHCRTQYRQQSFLPRTVRDWNDLPSRTVATDTLDAFKAGVPSQ